MDSRSKNARNIDRNGCFSKIIAPPELRARLYRCSHGAALQRWRTASAALQNIGNSDGVHRRFEGWPPTDSSSHHRRSHMTTTEQVERKSMHVKVKMEGVAIGRKVDLRDFDSYHDLTNTLMDMFAKYGKIESGEEYTLLYLDKEGDWMLVGDLDWEEFVESVRRVEILKNDNKMGFRLLLSKN
ncbi:auxin-responsive protein IAA28-like [Salvia hispanica]|uniref:auxin-responsive protein IAA28-like n=1 Tax=Salvia hispanica TaxID=49212 RepID=UPI002008FC18|nr:auxin-responsive protein IAA28-like [Salvia hispanica]